MHARCGVCLAPACGARCWGVQCRRCAVRMARRLANSRASRWEVVLPPSRGQAHLSWFSSTCRKKLAKDIASQGQCLSGLPKGWRCHPRVLSAPKILCPSLIRAKDVFPVSALKKTSTKREVPKWTRSFRTGSSSRSGSIPMATGDCALVSTMCRYASRNVNGANHPPPAISVFCRTALPTPDSPAPPHSCTDLAILPPGNVSRIAQRTCRISVPRCGAVWQ